MLPKTTPSQRLRLYRDVDDLISPGFLSHNLTVGRTTLALRTLGPGDLFLLRHRTGVDLEHWQLWALAASVWMVDGICVLSEPAWVPRIFQMVRRMPSRAQTVLFSTFTGLVNRATKAEDAVEPYMYETLSRVKWKALGGDMQNLRIGVPGSENLGMNIIQQIWVTYNIGEDDRIVQDQRWEGHKLVASSNSPKGVKKIDERDTQRRQEEEERRQSVMDRYFYYRMGVVNREGFVKGDDRDVPGIGIAGPKTVEQLETEMKRWVLGEADDHDQIIEAYKQRILDRQAEAEAERVERRTQLAAEADRRAVEGFKPTQMIGYTQEQLAQILAERDGGLPSTTRFIHDDAFEETKNRVQRHVHKADPGKLKVQGDRIMDPQADPNADKRTLQQLISDRQVGYSDEQPAAPAPAPTPKGQRPSHISQSDWEEFGGNLNPAAFGGETKGTK